MYDNLLELRANAATERAQAAALLERMGLAEHAGAKPRRYWIASLRWGTSMRGLQARSATLRATRQGGL